MAAKVEFVNRDDNAQRFKVFLFGPDKNRVKVATILGAFKASMAIVDDGDGDNSVMEADDDGLSMHTFVGGYSYTLLLRPQAAGEEGERPAKRLKASGTGFSESVNGVMQAWKKRFHEVFDTFKEKECKLPTQSGVPVDHRGHPTILLDKLTDGWTKDVGDLWKRANDTSTGIVPVIGVSGSGKTRFLNELLAEKWGFFWTASVKGNGGSDDVSFVTSHHTVSNKGKNHLNVMERMRCAILSRLLILEFCLHKIPQLSPLQWLMLQVQFRAFICKDGKDVDLYFALTKGLVKVVTSPEDSDGLNTMINKLWTRLEEKLGCAFTVVLDEAQVLGVKNVDEYKSPETQQLRSVFSPMVKALVEPSILLRKQKVFVAGTGVSFLKLEQDVGSVIAKEGGGDPVRFSSAPFSLWKDVDQVLEFCSGYLKLEDGHEKDNAHYLLEKFRGRRRCLVSCVERLLKEHGGGWSKEVVDNYFEEITTSKINNTTSIYYAVEALCGSKGTFVLNHKILSGASLVQRLGTSLAYVGRAEFIVSTDGDMTLLERGLGQLKHSTGSKFIFSIDEPTVHYSIMNYMRDTGLFEKSLNDYMVDCMDDSSAMGRLWEKLFTVHVAKMIDGTKLLADFCCFQNATLPSGFEIDKPTITGEGEGVWRESYVDHTVSAFLDAEEDSRPQCLIFDDRSGPDVLFVVRLGNLKIPVFCQLKLRSEVQWAKEVATTIPKLMYKGKDKVKFRRRVLAACKDGFISLIVVHPEWKPFKIVSKCQNHLVGYIGQAEVKNLFGGALCDFLGSIKQWR